MRFTVLLDLLGSGMCSEIHVILYESYLFVCDSRLCAVVFGVSFLPRVFWVRFVRVIIRLSS